MGKTFGRRIFARASDRALPPCKGSVLIGAPRLPGHASSVAHLAFYAYFMHARSGRARGSPLSSDAGWRIAGRARLCAPRVRGGSKPNPAPRNLGLDLILDNPTTNAPPPIHPVPPTLLHPDPSLLGVRNTEHRRMHSRPVTRIDRAHMDGTPPPTTCTNRMPLSKARTLPFAMHPETTCDALHRCIGPAPTHDMLTRAPILPEEVPPMLTGRDRSAYSAASGRLRLTTCSLSAQPSPSRAWIERTWTVPLPPQLAQTECLYSPKRGNATGSASDQRRGRQQDAHRERAR